MKNIFKKMKNRWHEYKKDHKNSSEILGESAKITGVGAVTAGLGYGTLGILSMGATSGAALTGVSAVVGIAGLGAVIAGTGFVIAAPVVAGIAGAQYLVEKRANKKIESVRNLAGQTVQGPHWALERLQQAQADIIDLTDTFNKKASHSSLMKQKIDEIIASTAEAQKEIVIASPGNQGADKEKYQFIRVRKDTDLI